MNDEMTRTERQCWVVVKINTVSGQFGVHNAYATKADAEFGIRAAMLIPNTFAYLTESSFVELGAVSSSDVENQSAYMCGGDWQYELGHARGPTSTYASPGEVKKHRKCVTHCGIVEVEVCLKKWITS